MATKVWLTPPVSVGGDPQEVEATPETLIPLMVEGWSQCEAPAPAPKKSKERVIDGEPA